MAIKERRLEQIEVDFETAHGELASGYIDPAVSADAKIIAAAIAQAGAQIALAVESAPERLARAGG